MEAVVSLLATAGTAWSLVWSVGWYSGIAPLSYLVPATLASLLAVSTVNTGLFAFSIRWSRTMQVTRLSGRIHSIVGGLYGLPLVVLALVGLSTQPLGHGLLDDLPYVMALVTTLLLLPLSGIVLSRSDQGNILIVSNALGLLGMLLGIAGFGLTWIITLAGFAA
jgi:hypothetical protein